MEAEASWTDVPALSLRVGEFNENPTFQAPRRMPIKAFEMRS